MKVNNILVLFLTVVLFSSSCENKKKVVIATDIPIKSEILGLKLCEVSNERDIERAISKETGYSVDVSSRYYGSQISVIALPNPPSIYYGGLIWHYVEVTLNEYNQIAEIALISTYEKAERAKDHFENAYSVCKKKYGKENVTEKDRMVFWSDYINLVGVSHFESTTTDGSVRWACQLRYMNRALCEAMENIVPDV